MDVSSVPGQMETFRHEHGILNPSYFHVLTQAKQAAQSNVPFLLFISVTQVCQANLLIINLKLLVKYIVYDIQETCTLNCILKKKKYKDETKNTMPFLGKEM